MALNSFLGSFQQPTATGNQSITGVGFQPKVVLFWMNGMANDGTTAFGNMDWGAAISSSNRWVVGASSNNSSTGAWSQNTTSCIQWTDATNNTNLNNVADFVSMDSDGFTVNWSKINASFQMVVNYLALGGTDLTNVALKVFQGGTASGNQAVTGVGFKPDAVLMRGIHVATLPYGPASGPSAEGYEMNASAFTASTRSATSMRGVSADTKYQSTSAAWSVASGSTATTPSQLADVVSMDSDGFTLNWTNTDTSNGYIFAVCLQGPQFTVGSFNQPTSNGSQSISGLPFQPQVLTMASFDNASSSNVITTIGDISFGAGTDSSHRTSMCWSQNNSVLNSQDRTKILTYRDNNGPTLRSQADLTSLDVSGFTLNWTTTDATARQIVYLAIGAAPVTFGTASLSATAGMYAGPLLPPVVASASLNAYASTLPTPPPYIRERTATSAAPPSGSAFNVTFPSGTTVGDYVVVVVAMNINSLPTPPAGWTQLGANAAGTTEGQVMYGAQYSPTLATNFTAPAASTVWVCNAYYAPGYYVGPDALATGSGFQGGVNTQANTGIPTPQITTGAGTADFEVLSYAWNGSQTISTVAAGSVIDITQITGSTLGVALGYNVLNPLPGNTATAAFSQTLSGIPTSNNKSVGVLTLRYTPVAALSSTAVTLPRPPIGTSLTATASLTASGYPTTVALTATASMSASSPPNPIVQVATNSTGASGTGSSTVVTSFPAPVKPGNTVYVFVGTNHFFNTAYLSPTAVVDNQGNTYTRDALGPGLPQGAAMSAQYSAFITSASGTFTVTATTANGNDATAVVIVEVQGITPSGWIDANIGAAGGNPITATPMQFTTSQSLELQFACFATYGINTVGAPTIDSFTPAYIPVASDASAVAVSGNAGNQQIAVWYRVLTSPTNVGATGNAYLGQSVGWAATVTTSDFIMADLAASASLVASGGPVIVGSAVLSATGSMVARISQVIAAATTAVTEVVAVRAAATTSATATMQPLPSVRARVPTGGTWTSGQSGATVTFPTGTQAGDYVIVAVQNAGTAGPSAPTGWTLIESISVGSGANFAVFGAQWASGLTNSFNNAASVAAWACGAYFVSGTALSGQVVVFDKFAGATNTTNNTTMTTGAPTPAVAGEYEVLAYGYTAGGTTISAVAAGSTIDISQANSTSVEVILGHNNTQSLTGAAPTAFSQTLSGSNNRKRGDGILLDGVPIVTASAALSSSTSLTSAGRPAASASPAATVSIATTQLSGKQATAAATTAVITVLRVAAQATLSSSASLAASTAPTQVFGNATTSATAALTTAQGVAPGPTYVAQVTDNFNRANAASLGPNWTAIGVSSPNQQWTISSNIAVPATTSNDCGEYYTAIPFGSDQYSKAQLTAAATTGGDGPGLTVRDSGTNPSNNNSHYIFTADHAASQNAGWIKVVNSTPTAFSTFTQPFTDGDTWEFDALASTLTLRYQGAAVFATTDSSIVTGSPGIYSNGGSAAARSLDNWEGGRVVNGPQLSATATLTAIAAPGTPIAISYPFNQSLINNNSTTLWTAYRSGGSVASTIETTTLTTIPDGSGGIYAGIFSNSTYDLTGRYCVIQVATTLNTGALGVTATFQMQVDNSNFLEIGQVDNTLVARYAVGGTTTPIASVALPATPFWMGFWELNGRVYFIYSTDRRTWIQLGNVADPIAITALTLVTAVGTYQSVASPGVSQWNYLNTISASATLASTASLTAVRSGAAALSATASLTASAGKIATLSATASLTTAQGVTVPTRSQQLASDDFNRANANPIGGNWTTQPSFADQQILSNTIAPSTAGECGAYYNAVTWPNDQYSQAQIATVGNGDGGPAVRSDSTTGSYYGSTTNGNYAVYKFNGGFTTLNQVPGAYNTNDTVYFEFRNTNYALKINGTTVLNSTDATLSSGSAGVHTDGDGTIRLDNWSGGSLISAAALSASASMVASAAAKSASLSASASITTTQAVATPQPRTTIASDNFNRANGPMGGNWTTYQNALTNNIVVNSNLALNGNNLDTGAYWSGSAFPPDQYSRANVTCTGSGTEAYVESGVGVGVRMSGAANSHLSDNNEYFMMADHNSVGNVCVVKYFGGTWITMGFATQAWSDGDIWEVTAQGSLITANYVTGGRNATVQATDSAITSGSPGIVYSSSTGYTGSSWDNWEGGSVNGAVVLSATASMTAVSPATAGYFVLDRFTLPDGAPMSQHMPDIGGAWTDQNNNAYISGGQMYWPPSASTTLVNAATPPSANYTVSVDATVVSNDGAQVGLLARIAGSGSFYHLNFNLNTNILELNVFASGAGTLLNSASLGTITTGTTYHLALTVTGSSITGSVNGVQAVSATDTTYATAGQVGMWPQFGSNGVPLDNFGAFVPTGVTATAALSASGTITTTQGVAPQGGYQPLARDTFNRVNSTGLGSNWNVSITQSAFNVSGGAAVPSVLTGSDSTEYWNAIAFPGNQYSKAQLTSGDNTGSGNGPGVIVRADTNSQTFYRVSCMHAASANIMLHKEIASAYTVLSQVSQAWNDGDTWEIDAVVTTITALRNGSRVTSASDASISLGSAGISVSTDVVSASIDNWEGGAITNGPVLLASGSLAAGTGANVSASDTASLTTSRPSVAASATLSASTAVATQQRVAVAAALSATATVSTTSAVAGRATLTDSTSLTTAQAVATGATASGTTSTSTSCRTAVSVSLSALASSSTAQGVSPQGGYQPLARDTFSRTNSTGLGANWATTPSDESFNISSSSAVPNTLGNDSNNYYSAITWPNNQYSKAQLAVNGAAGGQSGIGLMVRAASADGTWYRATVDHAAATNVDILKRVSFTYTDLGVVNLASWTDGDTWQLDVTGAALAFRRNGTPVNSATDSSITSGSAGIFYSSTEASASVDNWEGGAVTSGPVLVANGSLTSGTGANAALSATTSLSSAVSVAARATTAASTSLATTQAVAARASPSASATLAASVAVSGSISLSTIARLNTPALYFFDTFTAPDGTPLPNHFPDVGVNWIESRPGIILNNSLTSDPVFNFADEVATPQPPANNYKVTATFVAISAIPNTALATFLTVRDQGTGFPHNSYAGGWDFNNGGWFIGIRITNAVSYVVTTATPAFSPGDSRQVEFTVTGSSLILAVDGVVLLSTTDTTYTSGYAGAVVAPGAQGWVSIDNYTVTTDVGETVAATASLSATTSLTVTTTGTTTASAACSSTASLTTTQAVSTTSALSATTTLTAADAVAGRATLAGTATLVTTQAVATGATASDTTSVSTSCRTAANVSLSAAASTATTQGVSPQGSSYALATDNFNRPDGGLGNQWTTVTNLEIPAISANTVIDTNINGIDAAAYYNAVAAPPDQYAQVRAVSFGPTSAPSAVVRQSTTLQSSYIGFIDQAGSTYDIYKSVTGTYTLILTGPGTAASGDIVRLEIRGTNLSLKRNGAQVGFVSDAANSTGQFGIEIAEGGSGVTAALDDWEGGIATNGPALSSSTALTANTGANVATSDSASLSSTVAVASSAALASATSLTASAAVSARASPSSSTSLATTQAVATAASASASTGVTTTTTGTVLASATASDTTSLAAAGAIAAACSISATTTLAAVDRVSATATLSAATSLSSAQAVAAAPHTQALATDNFNRADGGLGPNWNTSVNNSPFVISSNTAVPSVLSGIDDFSSYIAVNFPDNQYAKAQLTVNGSSGAGQGLGVALRGSTTLNTQYRSFADHAATGNVGMAKCVNGNYVALVSANLAWTDGDTWEMDVSGSALLLLRNTSLVTNTTDSSLTSGVPGLAFSTNETSASADNWEAGAFYAATASDTASMFALASGNSLASLSASTSLSTAVRVAASATTSATATLSSVGAVSRAATASATTALTATAAVAVSVALSSSAALSAVAIVAANAALSAATSLSATGAPSATLTAADTTSLSATAAVSASAALASVTSISTTQAVASAATATSSGTLTVTTTGTTVGSATCSSSTTLASAIAVAAAASSSSSTTLVALGGPAATSSLSASASLSAAGAASVTVALSSTTTVSSTQAVAAGSTTSSATSVFCLSAGNSLASTSATVALATTSVVAATASASASGSVATVAAVARAATSADTTTLVATGAVAASATLNALATVAESPAVSAAATASDAASLAAAGAIAATASCSATASMAVTGIAAIFGSVAATDTTALSATAAISVSATETATSSLQTVTAVAVSATASATTSLAATGFAAGFATVAASATGSLATTAAVATTATASDTASLSVAVAAVATSTCSASTVLQTASAVAATATTSASSAMAVTAVSAVTATCSATTSLQATALQTVFATATCADTASLTVVVAVPRSASLTTSTALQAVGGPTASASISASVALALSYILSFVASVTTTASTSTTTTQRVVAAATAHADANAANVTVFRGDATASATTTISTQAFAGASAFASSSTSLTASGAVAVSPTLSASVVLATTSIAYGDATCAASGTLVTVSAATARGTASTSTSLAAAGGPTAAAHCVGAVHLATHHQLTVVATTRALTVLHFRAGIATDATATADSGLLVTVVATAHSETVLTADGQVTEWISVIHLSAEVVLLVEGTVLRPSWSGGLATATVGTSTTATRVGASNSAATGGATSARASTSGNTAVAVPGHPSTSATQP